MREVYSHCAEAAGNAGQAKKEAMYKKKSLEAAGAISKILEGIYAEEFQEKERKMA